MKQILKGGAIVYLCVLALTVPNENAIQLTATVVCHANRWARAISRMCRSSDRMIELQSNARPPQPSWGDRFQRVARTLRGNRFGPFRRRFAGSDGEDRRPAAALRLVPFPAAQSSAVRASRFPTRDGFCSVINITT